jgi:hypothetical protein
VSGPLFSRRRLVWLVASALGSALALRRSVADPSDQGIGGTGFSLRPADEESDRGIGGTGVIGTIRKFGSIIVNDLRISYPKDVTVHIDGRPAAAADLKIGQVVRVAAISGPKGALSTRAIDVTSEAVGPAEAVTPASLTVLGQTVSTAELKGGRSWKIGDHVAVSGLRRPDGTIVASLIEPAPADLYKTAGPLRRGADGVARIGHLALSRVAGAAEGERLIVEGHPEGQSLAVTKSSGDIVLFPASVKKLSIEAYVEQSATGLRLGSGQAASGQFTPALPAGRPVHAVITGIKGGDGRLKALSLRSGFQQYHAQRADGAKNPAGQNAPMDFDQAPQTGAPPYGNPPPPAGYYGQPSPDSLNPGPAGPGLPGAGLPGRFENGGFGGFGGRR